MRTWLLVGLFALGCSKDKPAPKPQHAAPPAKQVAATKAPVAHTGSKALAVLPDGNMAAVGPDGKGSPLGKVGNFEDCSVDKEHEVVWVLGDTELKAFDRRSKKLTTVATVPKGDIEAWGVQYTAPKAPYPDSSAGNIDGLEHCVALVMDLSDKPTIAGVIVADGDRAWYCGKLKDDADGELQIILNKEEKARMASYNSAKITNAAFIAPLAARRNDAKKAAPKLEKPAEPKLTIDKSACEVDEEECGKMEYLGGGRIWRVITGSSRGDFYHEHVSFYDAKDKVFWDLETGTKQSEPLGEGKEISDLEVAPDGSWAIHGEKIFSFEQAKEVGKLNFAFCGWQ